MRRFQVVVLLLSIVLAGPAAAQTPVALTLDDALARGVARAPRLAEARARETAASSMVTARTATGRPSVTATSGYLRTNHVEPFGIPQPDGTVRPLFPDIPDNYRARAEVAVPIFTGGRTAAAVEAAQAELRAASADARALEEDVRLDVIRAYWTLALARERARVLEADLDRMDAWVGDVRARLDAGLLPPNDVLSAQARRAREHVQLIQAQNAAALAEIDLARLIGLALGQPIDIATPVDQPLGGAADAMAQPADALAARAREGRAERWGVQARQQAFRAAAAAAFAATRPHIAGLAAVEPSRPNQRFVPRAAEWKTSWDLGVSVTWPLWDGGRARAERAASLAQAEGLGHRLEEFDDQIAVEIRQRRLEIEAGRAALQAADEAVAAAAEAHRVVAERFAAGVAAPTEVLDAQVERLEAELERTQIVVGLRLGEARLLRTMGEL